MSCGLAAALSLASLAGAQSVSPSRSSVPIPGGSAGIGFDDLRYCAALKRILAPAGRTGAIALIDPATLSVSTIGGFAASASYGDGHGEGTTSADEGAGLLFAVDRTVRELDAVDPAAKTIVARARLASAPDYVRFVAATGEVWVTQPDEERIEIFRFEPGRPPKIARSGFLPVPGGPESLVVDAARRRAYTNTWKGATLAIDLAERRIVARWKNGCAGSRGLALDSARGFLFVGCAEGKAIALDAASGRTLGSLSSGDGVDIIDFDPKLSHLYVPGGRSATMAILAVSPKGALSLLGTARTAPGSHCVAADGRGTAFVCDPKGGRLIAVRDPYPAAR